MIRAIANTQAFSDLNGGEILPGAGADLEGFIRSQGIDPVASGRHVQDRS